MKASLSRNPPPSSSPFQPQPVVSQNKATQQEPPVSIQQPNPQQQQELSQQLQATPAANPDNSGTRTPLEQQQSAKVKETNSGERQPSFTQRKLPAGLSNCERVVQIPQNIEYNREFIKSLDLDLTNAIIYNANQRGFVWLCTKRSKLNPYQQRNCRLACSEELPTASGTRNF